ncbi:MULTISPECIES: ABC transporter permease [unclassified Gordonia (in: high G+C Gram-positive bacteria)]|uniref:ABC transporter permease n=1 Tax=unclassified Gordonia (in: high G+C Gram-positive bacteria) TaxID=2657482 RepID=UPI001F100B3F|nr:ABC transporter permease [Gordonia sp. ABSL49_1]MCH5641867.1 ABC transporter permease [Gordonia sp. ABSL49_1]
MSSGVQLALSDKHIEEATAVPETTEDSAAVVAEASDDRAAWWHRVSSVAGKGVRVSLVLLVLALIWEVAPRIGAVDPTFLPPASTVAQALWELIGNGQLWQHVSASLSRALAGYLIAVAIGIPLGLLIGWYRLVAQWLNPALELFRNIAPLALLPVFVLVLGIGETSKVALVVYACLFPILLNTISAVRDVDPLLIKSARSLGLSPARLFAKVVLPASLPTIFTGLRLSAAASILVLIAAEMVGAQSGLGFLIMASQLSFQIPEMYAGIVAIAVVGVIFNAVLVLIERYFTRWRVDPGH